jgi:hypothetical protein
MIKKGRILFVFIGFILLLNSCRTIKIKLDQSGINDISTMILENYEGDSPGELKQFLKQVEPPVDIVNPVPAINREPLNQWLLEGDLIQEKIEFASTLKRENGGLDTAHFYLYRKSELKGGKVILWIPGFGVSDFAFHFVKKFFYQELEAGYAVLFYNIPYHLERIEEGREMGEGLFTGSHINNLETIQHVLHEIKTITGYLKKEGVTSLNGWGGSIGAAFLWLSSGSIKFDHMSLMIPIVDWNSIIFNPGFKEVVERMKASGQSEQMIRAVYSRVNPMDYPTLTQPGNIQILYAKHDQLTPEGTIMEFSQRWGIANSKGYEESHASILINSAVYRDNAAFLETLN